MERTTSLEKRVMRRFASSGFSALILFLCGIVMAAESAHVPFVFRAMAYDATLKRAHSGAIVVVVVHRVGDPAQCFRVVQAVVGEATFAGARLQLIDVPYIDAASFDASVVASAASAIYVCADLEAAVRAVSNAGRAHSVLTLCTNESYVRLGLSVGLVARDEHIKLFINLDAAHAEGAHFAPALLNVAEVIH